jgi:parallel beta-helix repeat protein
MSNLLLITIPKSNSKGNSTLIIQQLPENQTLRSISKLTFESPFLFGIWIEDGEDVKLERNTINNVFLGFALLAGGWIPGTYFPRNIVFKKNTLKNCARGISTGNCKDYIIEGNKIFPNNNFPVFALRDSWNGLVRGNIVQGSGWVGIWFYGNSSYNVCIGNNVQNFTATLPSFWPTAAVYWEETHDNVWVGDGGVVTDLGINNVITGSDLRDLSPEEGETLGQIMKCFESGGFWDETNQECAYS